MELGLNECTAGKLVWKSLEGNTHLNTHWSSKFLVRFARCQVTFDEKIEVRISAMWLLCADLGIELQLWQVWSYHTAPWLQSLFQTSCLADGLQVRSCCTMNIAGAKLVLGTLFNVYWSSQPCDVARALELISCFSSLSGFRQLFLESTE